MINIAVEGGAATVLRLKGMDTQGMLRTSIFKALEFLRGKIVKALAAGTYGIKTKTGMLLNSINVLMESDTVGVVGPNKVYARIQELGGEIRPKSAGALTIPIHPSAIGKRASDFPDLALIKSKGGNAILARVGGGGKNGYFIPMFVLKKSVKIPAHFYMRNTLEANKEEVLRMFDRQVAIEVKNVNKG